jgi:hypothetical protein
MSRLEDLATKMIWWKTPEEALKDRKRILAQIMVYGTVKDILVAKEFFSDADFLKVLEDPPSGVFDDRSWAYWSLMYDKYPPQPIPKRRLND